MAKIHSTDQAKTAIRDDAAIRAESYLETNAPQTLEAINHLIIKDGWSVDELMGYFQEIYDSTEEKTRVKIRLVAEAAVRERDK